MQTLNLINESKSDIKYHLLHFPDGEVQIVLGDINVKETVRVICRITSAEELFILAQACALVSELVNRWFPWKHERERRENARV